MACGNAVEKLIHSGLTRVGNQPAPKVFLQGLVRACRSLTQDPVGILRDVFDLRTGHGAILARHKRQNASGFYPQWAATQLPATVRVPHWRSCHGRCSKRIPCGRSRIGASNRYEDVRYGYGLPITRKPLWRLNRLQPSQIAAGQILIRLRVDVDPGLGACSGDRALDHRRRPRHQHLGRNLGAR